ncbi:MAG: hypothetical protein H0X66_12665 [Verrucomicrobia bacterium]|nr:hypothetical protein [Verrucomicrobiota bacterium]
MYKAEDIRYKADGPLTASIGTILLPLWALIKRPTSEQALKEAKRLVDQLAKESEQTGILGGKLTICDFSAPYHTQAARISIEQSSKKEVTLRCDFFAVLAFDSIGDFWSRADIISRHVDFLQRFCLAPRDKDIEVYAERAKFLTEKETKNGDAPDEVA